MLSDNVAACEAIALAPCLKNEKNRRWIRVVQTKKRLMNLMTDLMQSEPKDYIFFVRFESPSLDGVLRDYKGVVVKAQRY
jgi:hypothetical protein